MSSENSPVKDFYDEKNIFVTGATGFLGIALVEKLLRSCNVGTIYLLMRPKRGKDISVRLEELKKNLVRIFPFLFFIFFFGKVRKTKFFFGSRFRSLKKLKKKKGTRRLVNWLPYPEMSEKKVWVCREPTGKNSSTTFKSFSTRRQLWISKQV